MLDARKREPRTVWDAEETNVFKTVLQSIPLGASVSVISHKVHAALREQGLVKTSDQVQTKYYRLLKALVDHLGNEMPPKPYKQAAIQSALLIHWDKIIQGKLKGKGRLSQAAQRQKNPAKGSAGPGPEHFAAAAAAPASQSVVRGVPAASLAAPGSRCVASAAASLPACVTGNLASPSSRSGVSAAVCPGGRVSGTAASAAQLQYASKPPGAAASRPAGQLHLKHLAYTLTSHASSGQLALGVPEPQTPAETPPQLSRADTAEAAHPQLACRRQRQPSPSPAAQQQPHIHAQNPGGQRDPSSTGKLQAGGQGGDASAAPPASGRKAPKLALSIIPQDAELAASLENQGLPAYFELSCRGHKTMTALASALESQWGEAHQQSGRRMALWSTHVSAAAPMLCWGALSHPDVMVGDVYRSIGQPQPFSLSYTLQEPASCEPSLAAQQAQLPLPAVLPQCGPGKGLPPMQAPTDIHASVPAAAVPRSTSLPLSGQGQQALPMDQAHVCPLALGSTVLSSRALPPSSQPHSELQAPASMAPALTAPTQPLLSRPGSESAVGTKSAVAQGPCWPAPGPAFCSHSTASALVSREAAGASAAAEAPKSRAIQADQSTLASAQQLQQRVAETVAAGVQHRAQAHPIPAAPSAADPLLGDPCPPSIALEGPACFTSHGGGVCGDPVPAASQGASMRDMAGGKRCAEDSTQKSLHAGGDSCGFSSLFSMAATCDGFASNPALPARVAGVQHAKLGDHCSSRLGGKDSRERSRQGAGDSCALGSLLHMGITSEGSEGHPDRGCRPGSIQHAEAPKDCSHGAKNAFDGLLGLQSAAKHSEAAVAGAEPHAQSLPRAAALAGAETNGADTGQAERSKDSSLLHADSLSGKGAPCQGAKAIPDTSSKEEPLSFAGLFSQTGKQKQPSCLDGNSPAARQQSKQRRKRASKRKQQGGEATQEASEVGGASRKQQAKLSGAIFSEHTLPGLPEGLPGQPTATLQLPATAAEDLPDDLPAEPVVFWLPDARTTPTDPAHVLQGTGPPLPITDFQPSQLGSLLGNGNSWDAPSACGAFAAGANFCTERPFAELFTQDMI